MPCVSAPHNRDRGIIRSRQINLPHIRQVAAGASDEAGNIVTALGCQRPLVVTDKMMVQRGYVARGAFY